jgi:hypothetical protein
MSERLRGFAQRAGLRVLRFLVRLFRALLAFACIVVILRGLQIIDHTLWLEHGWETVHPVCGNHDGPVLLLDPMNPVFADNYKTQLAFRYGRAAVRRPDPYTVEVKAPIVAFTDYSWEYQTTYLVHMMAIRFGLIGPRRSNHPGKALVDCECAQHLALQERPAVLTQIGYDQGVWGRLSSWNSPWAERWLMRDWDPATEWAEPPDWVWNEESIALAVFPRREEIPARCIAHWSTVWDPGPFHGGITPIWDH